MLHFFKTLWFRKRRRASHPGLFGHTQFNDKVYLTAVTVLAGCLARCDGEANQAEQAAFERLFRVRPEERSILNSLFLHVDERGEGYLPFAAQLLYMLGTGNALLEDLLERLYRFAVADTPLTGPEARLLSRLADIFGLNDYWQRLAMPDKTDPYGVLGLQSDASDREVRAAWRRLSRLYHPDALAARGDEATDPGHMAEINAAYRQILRARRMKSA